MSLIGCMSLLGCSDGGQGPGTATSTTVHDAGETACYAATGMGPSGRNLEEWRSEDGSTFEFVRTFQVCADVPSLGSDGAGTLIAAYQGNEDPSDDARWDKIAVRISQDGGESWGDQQFITLSGQPEGTSRPFDPTIVWDPTSERWRMYFTVAGNEQGILDDETCTRSATSPDGVNYTFDMGTRFCASGKEVIDPAVVLNGETWHYTAPAGPPQDGAYHATSDNGLDFTSGPTIPSDMTHNWTGNLLVDGASLRFYGGEVNLPNGSSVLWWASSTDQGATWSDYVRTNVPAGKDPAIHLDTEGGYLLLVPTSRD